MITSPQHRIKEYTSKGWWGQDTLHSLLAQGNANHPQRLAVADQPNREQLVGSAPQRLSYTELNKASDALAEQLLASGIKLDDKIIVQLPNIVELVVLYYAASKIGAILSPVPMQYGDHELRSISHSLATSHIVTISQFSSSQPAAAAVALGLKVLCFGENIPHQALALSLGQCQDATLLRQHCHRYSAELDNANRILTICWTSGTTGTPKGVPRSHNMWLATAQAEIEPCDYRPADHLLNPFPLVNMAAIGGFLFPSVLMGASLFLHHPLDPAIFLQQMQQEKINFTIAPPALLNQLAKSPEMWQQFDFSALRKIGSGSAPLAPWMVEVFSREYGKEIINFYGSNEGICLLSTEETSPLPGQRAKMFPRLGAANIPWQGAVYQFAKTKLRDLHSGEEITEPGCVGELMIAGPTIFDGYFSAASDSDPSDGVFDEDGYFHTGDLVEICGESALHYQVVGRCKDIINRGGMKISPVEIDGLLESHNGVKEVAVCSYADDRLGERICACVVAVDSKQVPTVQILAEFLQAAGIAKYKLPERVELFNSLPRNALGKVLRFELQQQVANRKV